MKYVAWISLFMCLSGLSQQTFAEDGASLFVSKGCSACHGSKGMNPVAPMYPNVGGQNKEYTINQLNDIKSGKRVNGMAGMMMGIMATINDEEIVKLADFLAK